MHTLIIRHTTGDRFHVERLADGKCGPEVALQAPDQVQVEGRERSHLLRDLTWYLEQFLGYPFPPNTELAERIQAALDGWGRRCFERLFAGQPLLWYDQARQGGPRRSDREDRQRRPAGPRLALGGPGRPPGRHPGPRLPDRAPARRVARSLATARGPAAEPARRAFVDVLGRLADQLTPLQLHEQRGPFEVFGASFHRALALAEGLGMDRHVAMLLQSLAAHAQNRRDLGTAGRLFEAFARHCEAQDRQDWLAGAYHQLGMIAEEQRDLAAADAWYRESLAIDEKRGNEHGAAISCHELGIIAREQCDFASGEIWYLRALANFEKRDDEPNAASTYGQLGELLLAERNFIAAETWCRKALSIFEKRGNERDAASAYHQLSIIAQEQGDLDFAENCYHKALMIDEKQGNEHGAASTYGQLGLLSGDRGDVANARLWFLKAIGGFAKTSDPQGLEMAIRHFIETLQSAEPDTRATLRQAWQQAGLDQIAKLDDLERRLAEQPNDD